MVATDLVSSWYTALYEENCEGAMELLRRSPGLLMLGWEEEPKRVIKKSSQFYVVYPRGSWKGRTALHAGVNRGCLKLVKEAVRLIADSSSARTLITKADPDPVPEGDELSLGDLLAAVDGTYKLDALAMAVLYGNEEMILTLMRASFNCKDNPYEILSDQWKEHSVTTEETYHRELLRTITKEAVKSFCLLSKENSQDWQDLRLLYGQSRDFSFFPWEEYLFLFTFSVDFSSVFSNHASAQAYSKHHAGRSMSAQVRDIRNRITRRCSDDSQTLQFLVHLKDGQGRPPLHVAIDAGMVEEYKFLVRELESQLKAGGGVDNHARAAVWSSWLNVCDGAGRTPLHRAAATGNTQALDDLMECRRMHLNGMSCVPEFAKGSKSKTSTSSSRFLKTDFEDILRWQDCFDPDQLSMRNGFKGLSLESYDYPEPLQSAIIHRRKACVEMLINDKYRNEREQLGDGHSLHLNKPFTRNLELRDGGRTRFSMEPLQLAALVGDASIVELLLEVPSIGDEGNARGRVTCEERVEFLPYAYVPPALHVAAASANYLAVEVFLNNKHYDSLVEDDVSNTALHHAVKGSEFQFHAHLMDYVNPLHVGTSVGNQEGPEAMYELRKSCINLLLEAKIDLWKKNKGNKIPHPEFDAPSSFLSWWSKRLAKETIGLQNRLNAAANAISVTSALVATTSYMGPLQPPLGYGGDNNYDASEMRFTLLLVRVFVVSDNLSFYLAIVAVMLAVIPSLPMAQESNVDELRHTRSIVAIALGCLLLSIIAIVVAFSSASIALVIPHNGSSDHHLGLTLGTTFMGGLLCITVILLYWVRVFRFVYSHITIKKRLVGKFKDILRLFTSIKVLKLNYLFCTVT